MQFAHIYGLVIINMRFHESPHPIAFGASYGLVWAYDHFGHPILLKGLENVNREGAGLVGAPHRDAMDGVALGYALAKVDRVLYFMGKQELWTPRYTKKVGPLEINAGKVAGFFGTFPVDRQRPQVSTFKRADELIKDRLMVGLLPEGSRYEDEETKVVRGAEIGELHDSIGRLAVRNSTLDKPPVPILPAGIKIIRETSKKGRGGRIVGGVVVIGEKIIPDTSLPPYEVVDIVMKNLRGSLQELHYEADHLAQTK
ncbi:hypothetical protein BVY00_00625 [bacterium G20]|nr:hypothetical protein BVY00_00625 [bacterium G20]